MSSKENNNDDALGMTRHRAARSAQLDAACGREHAARFRGAAAASREETGRASAASEIMRIRMQYV